MAEKRDTQQEADVQGWIEEVIGEKFPEGVAYEDALKDGVILCKLINVLVPGSVKKINEGKMAFKQMENIGNFLTAVQGYGVPATDLFQTVDLYEGRNIPAVTQCLFALGRKAQAKGFDGPTLGPNFSEEQLRQGGGVLGLQEGSNMGASQAGLDSGIARQLND